MGLFYGRDRNGDGYVSPFDADETQDYVDPAKALEREEKQARKRDARRQTLDAHNDAQVAAARGGGRGTNGNSGSAAKPPLSAKQRRNAAMSGSSPSRPAPVRIRTSDHVGDDGSGQDRSSFQQTPYEQRPYDQSPYDQQTSPAPRAQTSGGSHGHAQTSHGNAKGPGASGSAAASRRPNGWATAAMVLAIIAWCMKTIPVVATAFGATAALCALVALARLVGNPDRTGKVRALFSLALAAWMLVGSAPAAVTVVRNGYDPFLSRGTSWRWSWSSDGSSSDDDSDYSSDDEPETDDDPVVAYESGTITRFDDDKADVSITAARRAADTYEGRDKPGRKTVMVTYHVTNRGSEAQSFDSFGYAAYQHGVGLDETNIYDFDHMSDADPDGLDYYDSRSRSTDIQPGATLDVTIAYVLRDDSDVMAEAGDYYSDVYVRRGFAFADGADAMTPLAQSDAEGAIRPESAADTTGMTQTYRRYKAEHTVMSMAFRVSGVRYVGKDYDDKDAVLVTFDWVNQAKHPFSFEDLSYPEVTQGGTELKSTSLDDPDVDQSRSPYRKLQPGAEGTVTEVYRLENTTDQLRVTFGGYRAPQLDQNFDVDGLPTK